MSLLQVVKDIGYKKLMSVWVNAIQHELLTCGLDGRCRDIDTGTLSLIVTEGSIDRKTTGIAEAVQHSIAMGRIFAQRFALIALIEKKACLLPLPWINEKQNTIFPDGHLGRYSTKYYLWPLYFQSLSTA